MDYINRPPAADGFRMPAEFERHQGCIMIWPERPGSWAYGAKAAKKAFAQIASVISESEQVYMIVSEGRKEEAAKILKLEKTDEVRVVIFRVIPNNDEGKFADKQRKELEIAEKMKNAFSEWIDNGHNNFDDENTIILCIELTDGLLLSHGTRYEF